MRTKIIFSLIACILSLSYACVNHPLDDNDLLITDRTECNMLTFELYGPDHRTVLKSYEIDTVACRVTATAKFGTNMKHLKPHCSVDNDAIMTPAMGTWVDFSSPRQYTVISGSRQQQKTFTITVKLENE